MAKTAFWARKRLGILPRYRTVPAESSRAEAERIELPLGAEESLIGVYANPPGTLQASVAVTSAAIAARAASGCWARMPYADLSAMRFDGGKDDWDVLTLVSVDGCELAIHMPGEEEKPAASLATFLAKVSTARRM